MIKKTIQSFAFFALLQVFIFSCCDDTFHVYYDTIEFTAIDELDFDTTTIASEDLVLNMNALYHYIPVSYYNELNQFSNSAYATTCDEDYILRETVNTIKITANANIFGIPMDNSLNEKLSYRNPETNENEALENIIEILNRQNVYGYDRLDLVLNEPIAAETALAFTIQLSIAENSRTLEATTQTITIE